MVGRGGRPCSARLCIRQLGPRFAVDERAREPVPHCHLAGKALACPTALLALGIRLGSSLALTLSLLAAPALAAAAAALAVDTTPPSSPPP